MQRLGLSHCSEGLSHPSGEPSSSLFCLKIILRKLSQSLVGHDIPQLSLNKNATDGPLSTSSTYEEIDDISRKIGYNDRIIISFRSGDPESPYNWSNVGFLTII